MTLLVIQSIGSSASTCCFTVPIELDATADGNSFSALPFNFNRYEGPIHYQQVYAASQFTNVSSGGAFLIGIAFRPDCLNQEGGRATNLSVRVSTSSRDPDALSSVFLQNPGKDEILVLSTNSFAFGGRCNGCACPQGRFASDFLNFTTPYFYNPAKGNLLIDLQNAGFTINHGQEPFGEIRVDTQNVVGDGVSRVAALSLTASVAEFVDTQGAVTLFEFFPSPSLSVELQGASLEIVWPTHPSVFQLQWATKLGSSAAWQNYPGSVHETFLERDVQIPLASPSLKTPKFFRLFWNSPQPGLSGGAIQALGSESSPPNN